MDSSAAATAKPPRWVPGTAWLVSVLTDAGAYGVATLAELALIRALRPSEQALTWTSDAVLAVTVGIVTYLWQHLRATRATLSAVERDGLVLDTQLSMAAEVQRSLLPVLPADGSAVEWAARLEPAGKIGGDFYDVVALDARSTAYDTLLHYGRSRSTTARNTLKMAALAPTPRASVRTATVA